MSNVKLNKILYIIVFIFIFIMFLLTMFAYYKRVIKKDNIKREVNNINMMITFDTSNIINANNLKKNFEVEKYFTIENYSKDSLGKYNIEIEVVTPLSNMVDEDFVYTLEGVSDSKDTSNKVVNISSTPVPVLTKTIGTATITPKNTHNYVLKIKLNNNKYVKNSLFNSKIKITIDN